MILDSAFLIDLLRESPDAFQKGVELAEQGIPQRVPTPVLYELQYGAEMAGDPDEQRAVRNLHRLYPTVRLTNELATEAAKLIADADKDAGGAGLSGIDDIDPLVAAVADSVDEPVLTDNPDHFGRLGVEVETW
jgi:hypothetical protein